MTAGNGSPHEAAVEIAKVPSGIEGFDTISHGGIPSSRTTLVTGPPGSGKTIFGLQFLIEGLQAGEGAVFVTFEDNPADIMSNMRGLGWKLSEFYESGSLAFVDATPHPEHIASEVGLFDLGGLLARVRGAVKRTEARRVVFDSLNALFAQVPDSLTMRLELFRIHHAARALGATVIMTAERDLGPSSDGRHTVEEYVADNVLVLRHLLVEDKRRRTVEVLKYRGSDHMAGEFPFVIRSGEGMVTIPLSDWVMEQASSTSRVTGGDEVLDEMTGGGFFRDSVILLSGATGTGKTLTSMQFIRGGVEAGERCLLFAFEESREQLFRNARSWGIDLEGMERSENLRAVTAYPHAMSIEQHLVRMLREIDAYKPDRIVVDSLTALERLSSGRGFREFVLNLAARLKDKEITSLFTTTSSVLFGGAQVTDRHISTLTDAIILLRYVELDGEMRRVITILKMRGSFHERAIREFRITPEGLQIGDRFHGLTGILSGNLSPVMSWNDPTDGS